MKRIQVCSRPYRYKCEFWIDVTEIGTRLVTFAALQPTQTMTTTGPSKTSYKHFNIGEITFDLLENLFDDLTL